MFLHTALVVAVLVIFALFFTWPFSTTETNSATTLTTFNINLHNPPEEIDGVLLGPGVTTLLVAQTDPKESGLYLTSPWSLIYQPTKTQTFTILQGTEYANSVIAFNPSTQSYALPDTSPTSEIITNSTLEGNGTLTDPLGLAPNGASTGDVMTYNGLEWKGAIPAVPSKSAGETYDSWDTGVGVQAWAATVGTIQYDGRLFNNSANVGDSFEWTMGSSGSKPSVVGQFYRFRYNVETASTRGIANVLVDNMISQSIDTYGNAGTVSVSYATDWYQATNTSMKFQITVTGKNPASSTDLIAMTSLGIDILTSVS